MTEQDRLPEPGDRICSKCGYLPDVGDPPEYQSCPVCGSPMEQIAEVRQCPTPEGARWSPGIERVLRHIESTDGWHLWRGRLRRRMPLASLPAMCPIESVGWDFSKTSPAEGCAIMRAADADACGFDPALRAEMLKRAGVKG
jgi:hypothetical protein